MWSARPPGGVRRPSARPRTTRRAPGGPRRRPGRAAGRRPARAGPSRRRASHLVDLGAVERAQPHARCVLGVPEVGELLAQPLPVAAVAGRRRERPAASGRPTARGRCGRSGRPPQTAARSRGRGPVARRGAPRGSAPTIPGPPSARSPCAPPARRSRPARAAGSTPRRGPGRPANADGRRTRRTGPSGRAWGHCASSLEAPGAGRGQRRPRWGIMGTHQACGGLVPHASGHEREEEVRGWRQ